MRAGDELRPRTREGAAQRRLLRLVPGPLAAIPWFPPAGHRLPRAWAQPKRSWTLSRGLHGQELLSVFQAVMGFMSTAQAELAGPLNRRAGREGEAARMESPAAITGVLLIFVQL